MQGWAFYWGTSEWSAEQLSEAWGIANRLGLHGPAMEQPQYNMLERQKVGAPVLIVESPQLCLGPALCPGCAAEAVA